MSKLKKHEIEAYINEPVKRSGELFNAYKIALDPEKWEQEKEEQRMMNEEALSCSFCGDIFQDAVILNCGHSLCLHCLKKIENVSLLKNLDPKCSTCSQSWIIGTDPKPNYELRSIVEKYQKGM